MLHKRMIRYVFVALAPLSLIALAGACGSVESAVLGETVPADAAETTLTDTLTDETTADANGTTECDGFREGGHGGPGGPPPGGPPLTEEQHAALEELLAQWVDGVITDEEFCELAREIVGKPPCGPPLPPIHLTEEQLDAAEAIFVDARSTFLTLAETARADVLAALSEEQQTALLALEDELPMPPARPIVPGGPACPPPEDAECGRPALVPLAMCPPRPDHGPAGMMRGSPGHGPADFAGMPQPGPARGGLPLCADDELIEELGLTEAQLEAIEAIHEAFRASGDDVHAAAWDAFLALLTEEQLAAREDLPPPPPPRHPHP